MHDAEHEVVDPAGAIFMALADPTRRHVLEQLAGGAATPTSLAAGLPMSRQAVAKHLTILEQAGLVAAERAGRERRYVLAPGPLRDATLWLESLEARWDDRLAALERFLAENPDE